MPRTLPRQRPALIAAPASGLGWRAFSLIALWLGLALVGCRALMPEGIRGTDDPLAGGVISPAVAGPAGTLVLDLLFCIPALLVLGRRALDPGYRLVFRVSTIPMLLLGVLAMISPLWAADRFVAAIGAAHLLTAVVFLWSMSQLIEFPASVRLVAGLGVGLFICQIAIGYHYRTIEFSELYQTWQSQKSAIIAQHGWTPGSFEATQFEGRLLGGEPMGFLSSTNSYAAILVLLGLLTAGVLIDRLFEESTVKTWPRRVATLALCALLPLAALPLLRWTHCRAAYATPIFGALLLVAGGRARHLSRRRVAIAYAGGLIALALVVALLLHHGLATGNLWHESLTYRLRYWTGAYRILTAGVSQSPAIYGRLLLGVGWENFGPHYLVHRLAIATEEIRDPHNFIVRIFTELGVVGGALLLLWMLGITWEIIAPVRPFVAGNEFSSPAAGLQQHDGFRRPTQAALIIAIVAITLNTAFSLDFSAGGDYVFLEIVRRMVFCAAIFGGILMAIHPMSVMAGHRRGAGPASQAGPTDAPWPALGIAAGLATFLLHNLIEFSLFEPGPLFLAALLIGTLLGRKNRFLAAALSSSANGAKPRRSRPVSVAAWIAAAMLWLSAAIFFVLPVASAESLARSADRLAARGFSQDRSEGPAVQQAARDEAAAQMTAAAQALPWNADYAYRAARYVVAAGAKPAAARDLIDAAIAHDPMSAQYFNFRARLEFAADPETALADERRAIALDPCDFRQRIQFAQTLRTLARRDHRPDFDREALDQLRAALRVNDALPAAEVKRLSSADRSTAQAAVDDLHHLLPPS